MMTAEEICQISADIIGLSYPSDRSKLFFLCRMTNHEIWKQGRYHGMIKEFYVNTKVDECGRKYITSPNGHNVLLGVNLNTKPTRINNNWFQFHRNGSGSWDSDKNWKGIGGVMDMGPSPVIEQPRARNEISTSENDPVYIAVRSRGIEDAGIVVTINGENRLGEDHYTFTPIVETPFIRTLKNPIDTTIAKADVTYGAQYKLTNKFTLFENVFWSRINSISKPVTRHPVDVYAVHDTGETYLLATLAPHQRNSSYRNYLIPDDECCNAQCVHALFKMSEPESIEYPTQLMVTDNITALMDMMIGMDYKYYKKDLPNAAIYILSSVRALEDATRENQSNHESQIQVDELVYGTPIEYLTDNY